MEDIEFDFETKYIDELIDIRKYARVSKNWHLSDKIRDYLDEKLVFIFDANWGQEVYYSTECFFKRKEQKEETKLMTKRQYVEYIKRLGLLDFKKQ